MRQNDADLPKPLVRIGDRTMLYEVLSTFAHYGHTEFVLALGYQAEAIKSYFLHRPQLTTDFTIDFGRPGSVIYHTESPERGWCVSCIDTGRDSCTGTRLVRAARYARGDTVMVTYADCIADIDIAALLRFHRGHGRLGTITAVRPPGRFGVLDIGAAGEVRSFEEKPARSAEVVNGGYMVFDRAAIGRYVEPRGDIMLEAGPLQEMAADGQLMAYRHDGFWQPVDTPSEREELERLSMTGRAPWSRGR
jgi:glucose-1-phosphate cytidylyltransferase